MRPLRTYALFGDYGRYRGRRISTRYFEWLHSAYLFENYFSLSPSFFVDQQVLRKVIQEISSPEVEVVYCGDSAEALLLQYVMAKQNMPPRPFIVNDPDCFAKAKKVDSLLQLRYGESFFESFLLSPRNFWFVTSRARMTTYVQLGIPSLQLCYIPISLATLKAFFPSLVASIKRAKPSMGKKPLACGSHNRDYRLLLEALKALEVEVEIICDPKAFPPLPSPKALWRGSLPEREYVEAIASSRYVIIPLKAEDRVAGQMSCCIARNLGKLLIAPFSAGLEEYIEDGKTGFLYIQGDVRSLREKILFAEEILKEAEEYIEAGQEAEKRLSSTAEAGLEKLHTLVFELLEKTSMVGTG